MTQTHGDADVGARSEQSIYRSGAKKGLPKFCECGGRRHAAGAEAMNQSTWITMSDDDDVTLETFRFNSYWGGSAGSYVGLPMAELGLRITINNMWKTTLAVWVILALLLRALGVWP